jgi:hypothetical protein
MANKIPFNFTALKKLQPFVLRKISQHFPSIEVSRILFIYKIVESHCCAKPRPAITRYFMMNPMPKCFSYLKRRTMKD